MPRSPALALPLPLLLALAACGTSTPDESPGGVSEGEAAALNDAAAMLDANAMAPPPANAQIKE